MPQQGLAYRAGLLFLASDLPGQATPETVRWGGRFYQRAGARYKPVTDEAVEASLARWLSRNPVVLTEGDKVRPVTAGLLRDAMLAVRSESTVPDDVTPGSWLEGPPAGAVGPFLATPGGVLDLGSIGEGGAAVLAGGPDFFTLAAMAVTPDPAATCPRWLAFLDETFSGDPAAVELLREAFGYCLWPDCRFEKFFILAGPGNAGKSTAAETLQSMLGEGNVSALPLERLGDRFSLPSLVGKLANVVFDASEIDRAAEGVLKAMVSGEPVTVEEKHQPVRTMRLTAKHVFVTNVLPRFHDTSDGIWRRLLLVPFERACPPDQRDLGLKAGLREELPAIAHWAVGGLARLLERGGFCAFDRGNRLADEFRHESNPVAVFLASECVAEPDGRVGRREAYVRYRRWAADNGHTPLSVTRFNREVRAVHPQPEEEVRDGRGGDRMFVGFRLREGAGVMQQFRLLADGRAEGA